MKSKWNEIGDDGLLSGSKQRLECGMTFGGNGANCCSTPKGVEPGRVLQ